MGNRTRCWRSSPSEERIDARPNQRTKAGKFRQSITGATEIYLCSVLSSPSFQDKLTPWGLSLGNASAYESTLRSKLPVSYDTAIDTIYSDWMKLQTIAAKHDDTSSVWQIPNGVVSDGISAAIGMGATRSLYIQTVPNYYSRDTYSSVPIDSLSKLGMYYVYLVDKLTNKFTCTASYQADLSTEAYAIYPSLGPASPNHDMFVIGGTINNQDSFVRLGSLLRQATQHPGKPFLHFFVYLRECAESGKTLAMKWG